MKKSKIWHSSKGVNPWFWSKNVHFSYFYFLGDTEQENVFYDILERKNDFLSYKNKNLKNSKNWHFSKGVNPWFWSRKGHFSNFYFLENTGQENVFYNILERKNTFLAYKNKKFKNSKDWHFSKGVNPWFWSKNGHFSSLFFRQCRPGKCLLRYSRTKKRHCRLKKQEVQNLEKLTFFQRGWPMVLVQKWPCLQLLFFRKYRPRKCLLRYSRTKKHLSRLQKQEVQKVEKLTLS